VPPGRRSGRLAVVGRGSLGPGTAGHRHGGWHGGSGFTGDNGPATSASLKSPVGIAVDGAGNLYIADSSNNRIRRVDAQTGVITTVAGNGACCYSGDGGPATSAALSVGGIAADSAGNLFVAGGYTNRIRRVDAQTHLITTVAGSGASGYSGDGFDAPSASLDDPQAVAEDSTGNLFIADTNNNCIRGWTREPASSRRWRQRLFRLRGGRRRGNRRQSRQSHGRCGGRLGNLFIADESNSRVRRVDARTGVITTVAGNGDDGFSSQNGVPATSTGCTLWAWRWMARGICTLRTPGTTGSGGWTPRPA